MDIHNGPAEEGMEKAAESKEISRQKTPEKFGEKSPLLEEEILELERKIEQKKEELERAKRLEGAVEKIGEKTPSSAPLSTSQKEELTKEEKFSLKKIKTFPQEKQLEALSEIAIWQGLGPAIKIAKALNNAYILDEFHDTLIDKLYKELREKGEIKE